MQEWDEVLEHEEVGMTGGEKRYRTGDAGSGAQIIQGDNNIVVNPALPGAGTLLDQGVLRERKFDPERFLDRHDARDRFSKLLRLEGSRRLLAIRAEGGVGKSDLLRWFEWTCDFPAHGTPATPVSRVPLDQVKGGRVVDLVNRIRADLPTLDWSSFEAFKKRWLRFDVNLLDEDYVQALIDARGAEIKGSAKVIGINFRKAKNVYVTGSPGWPSEYFANEVNERYVQVFCADLKCNADRGPVALLFDAYDKAPGLLSDWIDGFIDSHCLDRKERPGQLAIVLAGRTLPPIKARLGDRFEDLVDMIDAFEDWTDDLVARFLEQEGFSDATAGEIALLRERINGGFPLENVKSAMVACRKAFGNRP